MKTKKENKESKNTWIQYGIIAVVAFTLYVTGLHTEVIAFAQRGLLATGLMNPDVEQITESRKKEKKGYDQPVDDTVKADFNFPLIDSYGKTVSLADFKGKVIFLNMWATWCPPCIAEMPSINDLHKELGNDVVFVMVSLDQDFNKAIKFNSNKGYDLPIYTPLGNLPSQYQSTSIPTTYVIDAAGNLALIHEGMADYNNSSFKDFLNNLK